MKKIKYCIIIIIVFASIFSSCVSNNVSDNIKSDQSDNEAIASLLASFFSTFGVRVNFDEKTGISERDALSFFCNFELGNRDNYIKKEYQEYLSNDGLKINIPQSIVIDKLNSILNIQYSDCDIKYSLSRGNSDVLNCRCIIDKIIKDKNIYIINCKIESRIPIKYDENNNIIYYDIPIGSSNVCLEKNNERFKIVSCKCEPAAYVEPNNSIQSNINDIVSDHYLKNKIIEYVASFSSIFEYGDDRKVPVDALINYFCIFELGDIDNIISPKYEQYIIPDSYSVLIPSSIVVNYLEKEFNTTVDINDSIYITNAGKDFILSRRMNDSTQKINVKSITNESDETVVVFETNDDTFNNNTVTTELRLVNHYDDYSFVSSRHLYD